MAQTRSEQSAPINPLKHVHSRVESQEPWPLQEFGQIVPAETKRGDEERLKAQPLSSSDSVFFDAD